MRIAVVGAGVVGVATAYLLAREGHSVVLIDGACEPGRGASAGNAAQLSWAYADAMASPALLRHLPAIMAGRDPAFRVRWRLDPDFLLWGLRFLANAPGWRWRGNTDAILRLAGESREEMEKLLAEVDIDFDYRLAGKLHLYPDEASLAAAKPGVERKRRLGFEQSILSLSEAQAVEPALQNYQGEIAGAVYTPGDAMGDAAAFCRQLTRHMADHLGVVTCFNRQVVGFEQRHGKLTALRFADHEPLETDRAVVTAGPLIHGLMADLPEVADVQPVRGYSLTIARSPNAPLVSLTDVKRKLAFVAIGDRFRVAGLADIERPGAGFDAGRFDVLHAAARSVLPGCFDDAQELMRWSGERPMTPSSRPMIGPSRNLAGVYINAGHGMLGWTLALGSARRIAGFLN
ncbi:D-amino acid dehydrogenase small subunit [Rhizobium dioscoreae]|uniref:FAD-dependent oxidoreductase n=1 Tax=Rhizobium dioscoreae TaxID=2653122 RepID=UPI0012608B18|nr:FAD-dependent oxidoreductase [Rhizobium dioscoreae]GES45972.1 D-amino acid dehydrogenase small subunit [Rhizobium dioscoreae]